MIVICSADNKVRERWTSGLGSLHDVQEVPTLSELQGYLEATPPDLILLHLSLPGLDRDHRLPGLDGGIPTTRIFAFSDEPNEREGLHLLRAGVRGYANTFMAPELLRTAVNVVLAGEIWAGRKLVELLIRAMTRVAPDEPEESIAGLDALTERERDTARLVAQGMSNKQVAGELDITERTVKAHLSAIFQKTGIRNRLQLALMMKGAKA